MKTMIYAALLLLPISVACVTVPKELKEARDAYQHANTDEVMKRAPAELREAERALSDAEQSFSVKPRSYRTRDLAYVAQRKAQLAEVRAAIAAAQVTSKKAAKELEKTQQAVLQKTKEDLEKTKQNLDLLRVELQKLSTVTVVESETRGLVVTISGSVLFASGKSMLLPTARTRLDQVADALKTTPDRRLVVEGHTDSQGSHSYNYMLSRDRAEAVRSYLISRGYSESLIEARGMGEDQPIASNDTPEGRANNRRVEIVIASK